MEGEWQEIAPLPRKIGEEPIRGRARRAALRCEKLHHDRSLGSHCGNGKQSEKEAERQEARQHEIAPRWAIWMYSRIDAGMLLPDEVRKPDGRWHLVAMGAPQSHAD